MCARWVLAAILMLCIGWARGAEPEPMILEAVVNGVRKGDLLAAPQLPPGGPVWIKEADFARLGITLPGLPSMRIGAETYVRLDPSDALKVTVDLDALELRIAAAPELLERQVMSLRLGGLIPVSPSPGPHAYANYSAALQTATGVGIIGTLDVAPTLGLGDWVLRSEHNMVSSGRERRSLRLRTFAQRDFPERMVRLQLGDVSASSGAFGRTGPIGGISVSRLFDLQPGFVRAPSLAYAGSVSGASTAEIFVDGARVRTVPLRPGVFEFRDLYAFAGLRNVEIVVSDAFGRRESIALPFYFSDQTLRAGLHEFSYTIGAPRRGLTLGGGYAGAAVSGFHRYGFTDTFTAGITFENLQGYRALGASAAARLGLFGTATLNASHSAAAESGNALLGTYGYAAGRFAVGTSAQWQSRGFGRHEDTGSVSLAPVAQRAQRTLNLSVAIDARQSVGVDVSRSEVYDRAPRSLAALRYTLNASPGVALNATLGRRSDGVQSGNEAMLSLSINLDRNWNATARAESRLGGGALESLRVTRSIPVSDGVGGRFALDRAQGTTSSEIFLQHNGAAGSVGVSARRQDPASGPAIEGGELRASGAVAVLGGSAFATRTIDQSFAVVDAGGLPGVRVYQNNQLVGRTRTDGRLLVPGSAAYTANQLRLDDRDIPLEVQLASVVETAVPRALSGTLVRFATKRISSVSGTLRLVHKDRPLPVASVSLAAEGGGRTLASATGPDGDFYLEDVGAGDYSLVAAGGDLRCMARFSLPESRPAHTDLGELACVESR